MTPSNDASEGRFVNIVTLACKDEEHAARCLTALRLHGKPDALSFNCLSYEFGLKEGSPDTVYIVEHWARWEDLESCIAEKVAPVLPMYNELLKRLFDPARDTVRIALASS